MVRNDLNHKRLSIEGFFWLTSMVVLALLFGFFVRLSVERSGNHRFLVLSTALLLYPIFLTVIEAVFLDHVYPFDLWNRFFFPFLFAFVSLNSQEGTNNVIEADVTLFLALLFLVRHTLIFMMKLLLRPIQAGEYKLSLVHGKSMEPTILNGDVVVISPEVHDLNPGNVVEVRVPARYASKARNIVHRLVWTNGRMIQTKGDNNYHLDPKIPVENVEGIAVAVLREYGDNIHVETFSDDFCPTRDILVKAKKLSYRYGRINSISRLLGVYLPPLVSVLLTFILLRI